MKRYDWYDKFGMLHLHIQPSELTENGMKITVEEELLREKLELGVNLKRVINTSTQHLDHSKNQRKGWQFTQSPYHKDKKMGHDNMTSLMGYSFKHNIATVENFKIFGRVERPDDIIFYCWMRGKWYDKWANLFLWIIALKCIQSCAKKYKYRDEHTNKKYSFLTRAYGFLKEFTAPLMDALFDWIPSTTRRIIHTDGKLLTFVRCECTQEKSKLMAWTYRKCNKILQRHDIWWSSVYGGHWMAIFAYYYKDTNHPNNVLARAIWHKGVKLVDDSWYFKAQSS